MVRYQMMTDEQHAFLQDVAKLLIFVSHLDYKVTGGELWRPQETQNWYIEHGLSHAKDSNHLRRLAIDLNFLKDDKLVSCPAEVGEYWESLNPQNRWGGHFKSLPDYDHFERNVVVVA